MIERVYAKPSISPNMKNLPTIITTGAELCPGQPPPYRFAI
jgi:hypothetical protein